jgi:hypothetical protein
LTEKAVDLALHSPTDKVYQDIVKESALKPHSYAEIFNEYKGILPSDATLKAKLIKDYKFNADKVDRFISNFKNTLAFAGLISEGQEELSKTEDEMIKDIAKAKVSSLTPPAGTFTLKPQGIVESFPIPLSEGKKAAIVFESLPVKQKDIKKIKEWLKLFADSLTGTESEDTDTELKIITTKEEVKEVLEAIIEIIKKEFPDTASKVMSEVVKIEIAVS